MNRGDNDPETETVDTQPDDQPDADPDTQSDPSLDDSTSSEWASEGGATEEGPAEDAGNTGSA